ncbi:hypothetical protein T11_17811 [Trichinella zimbabwensis]|uniref:Uncharacterized protein n=1 Tax=Trichinella zimbabwensis TaxID=268475 RepID=A0A0V1I5Y1_9BILA|nr:hypothetical protein T11_17811 [Trichinella zimbabwensis]
MEEGAKLAKKVLKKRVDNLELNPADKFTSKSPSIKHNCCTFQQSIVITFPIVPAYTARANTSNTDDQHCSSRTKIY